MMVFSAEDGEWMRLGGRSDETVSMVSLSTLDVAFLVLPTASLNAPLRLRKPLRIEPLKV